MKTIVLCVVALGFLAYFATASQAQYPNMPGMGGQVGRPAVSPYLNIIRGGDPGINYYGLVRPQVAAAKAFQSLGDNIVALEASANQPLQTGHTSSFMTHYRYFGTSVGRPGGQGVQQRLGQQGAQQTGARNTQGAGGVQSPR